MIDLDAVLGFLEILIGLFQLIGSNSMFELNRVLVNDVLAKKEKEKQARHIMIEAERHVVMDK